MTPATLPTASPAPLETDGERFIGWPLWALLAVFVASRLFAVWHGVRIDLGASYQWQLMDPVLLENQLAESLWNLHSQPPLFNLLHGLVLKSFVSLPHRIWAWQALQLVFGLVMVVSLYGAMMRLGIHRVLAAILTAIFCCSPSSVALFSLVTFLRSPGSLALWAFGLAIAALCLTRSAYHLLWLCSVAAVVCFFSLRAGSFLPRVAVVMLVSVMMVGALYVKNLQVFHFFGASSWMGMNLATMTHTNLDTNVRAELRRSGKVSDLILTDPFVALSNYPADFRSHVPSNVAALDQEVRFDNSPNFNHRDFLPISRQYGADAVEVIRQQPMHYAKAVLRNVVTWLFRSSADYPLIAGNVQKMRDWDAIYSFLVLGQPGSLNRIFSERSVGDDGAEPLKHLSLEAAVARKAGEACLLLAAMLVTLAAFCARRMWSPKSEQERCLYWVAGLTLLYITTVTIFANFGEAQRMRFEIEPLLTILLGLLLRDLWAKYRRRHRLARA
jgi:hypothetical protein